MLRAQPSWLRWRLRSSYASGVPAVPGDFLSVPDGMAAPTTAVVLSNFVWATNVTAPLTAFGRNCLRWSYQAISVKRLSIVLPPWSGTVPLQVPAPATALLPSLAELRFSAVMAWAGASGAVGDVSFSGFTLSDWNGFGTGASGVAPWPDLAGASYIGLLINRFTGVCQIAVKAQGVGVRTVIATIAPLAQVTPFAVDHRFRQATAIQAARYECRINGVVVATYSFGSVGAPVYVAASDGVAPAIYGTGYDVGGAGRTEDIFQLDCLAGAGAFDYPIG